MICVNSVSVSPKQITLQVGKWFYEACALVCPSNADCTEVTWHSDNSSVASVNASNGYIYANAVGTTKIYATATDGSGCSDFLTVTVSNTIPVDSVTLSQTALSVEEGQEAILCATVCPENATDPSLSWSSSNTAVATVCDGVVTAVAKGSTRITATATDGSGKSASCLVTVTGDILVTDICIYFSSHFLLEESSIRLRATVCPINATNTCVTWTSSDPNIATINPDSGIVLAQKEGDVTIFATAQDGSGVVGTYDLTVLPRVYADSMTISPNTATMYVEGQKGFCATIYPENTTSKTVRWSSENCNIAEVDSVTGCVLAKALGTTKIYATAQDGSDVSAYATVTVVPRPVTDVMIRQDSVTLKKGETTQLSVLVFPGHATNRTVTWESSDTDIATVSSGGLVTAISDGTATITVETNDGGFTDECTVTVDSREKVTITKDGNYFNITFSNGLVWKNVGRDLSLDENTSGNLGYGYLEWDNLYKWEQRFLDNFQNSYTEDQLAYIYYFDPLGVEDYMVNTQAPIYENKSTLKSLEFKDSLYNKIFGIIPNKFYFNEDGEYSDYQNYQGWNRLNYYSNAEILFGWHRTPFNWNSVVKAGLSTLFDLAIGLIPPISYIQNGIMLYKYAFYGASINDFSTTLLTSYFDLYDANLMVWGISFFSAIGDATFSQFEIPNDMTVDVYYKIESLENYRTVFIIAGTEVSMSDVITHC